MRGGFYCPVCEGNMFVSGVNDLATLYPEIATMYDPERNNAPVNQVPANSRDSSIWWVCTDNPEHHFQRSVTRMLEAKGRCPICTHQVVVSGQNGIAHAFPWLAELWDTEANGIEPDKVIESANSRMSFRCDQGHTYSIGILAQLHHGPGCMVCDNSVLMDGVNSVADKYPELMTHLSPENTEDPHHLFYTTKLPLLWTCGLCGGTFAMAACNRTTDVEDCPYCNNRKALPGRNDYAAIHPELLDEYAPDNERKPDELVVTWKTNVKWVCPTCHGEYECSPVNRKKGDNACPYCNGRRVLSGYNDLATIHPELMKEWSYPDNMIRHIDPTQISDKSSQIIWWVCDKHSRRKTYPMKVSDRVLMQKRHMTACPYCRGNRIRRTIIPF